MVLGAILSSCTDLGEPEASSEAILPTVTPTPEPDAVDTGTAEPTATATPMRATPTPTPLPAPTSTPTPPTGCDTPTAAEYSTAIIDKGLGIGESIGEIGELFSLGVSALLDPEWQLQVAVHLVFLDVTADEILALSPPPILEPVHAYMVTLANAVKRYVDLAVRGIDNFDAGLIKQATSELNKVGPLSESVLAEFTRICG